MKKTLLVLFLPMILILSGCFGDAVQDDIINYSNKEMLKVNELEDVAITAYDNVSGANYTDDATMHAALVDVVIPNYYQLIKELKSVDIKTDELKEVHKHFIAGAEVQYEAFETIVEALEKQDAGLIDVANGMLEQARRHIRNYQMELDILAEKHDVKWEDERGEAL